MSSEYRSFAVRILVILFLVGFFYLSLNPNQVKTTLQKLDNNISSQEIKRELVSNFKNSYPEDLSTNGEIKEFDLVAKKSEIELIKGIETNVWNYNDQVPGPIIKVNLGDTVRVNFTNQLEDETTIHWHGVRVPNAMDGVPGVTQDPIGPGESFTYQFIPKDAGTFWYHPHVRGAEQVERGLYGIFIVDDPRDPDYDQDVTLVVDDWRLTQTGQIDPNFVTRMDLMHDGRWGSNITVNSKSLEEIEAKSGDRLRLRFINPSNGRVYQPNFGNLNSEIIAVDGMKVKKSYPAQGFELAPGNRLDVDIQIPVEAEQGKSYYIYDFFTGQRNNLAKITVSGMNNQVKTFNTPIADYFPDFSKALELNPDHEYILDARRSRGMMGIEWTINGLAYPDYDPITLKAGEFNKIRFINKSARLHPMHLHGQFFQVLARNGKAVNEPFWRDTVLLHSNESVDIGLVPIDKGEWASHCHILEHAEAGMMTVVKVE